MNLTKALKCFQTCLPRAATPTQRSDYMKTYADLMESWQRDQNTEAQVDQSSPTRPLCEPSWPMPAMHTAEAASHAPSRRRQSLCALDDVLVDNDSSQRISARLSLPDKGDPPCTYEIEVPENTCPGDKLLVVTDEGAKLKITVPEGAHVGDILTFVFHNSNERKPQSRQRRFSTDVRRCEDSVTNKRKSLRARRSIVSGKENRMMEVDMPLGARAGDVLEVMTPDGRLFSITVPEGTEPGMALAFVLPRSHADLELAENLGALRDGHVLGEVAV